jgi:DNA polymerase-3 subunit alpha
MAQQRERFVSGAKQLGFPQRKIEKIFDLMEQFAGYGFNKSHSAAYAYLAYVTAYLKAHYPLDFLSSLLTSETGNTAKIVKYINECREMGIQVLPPDVKASRLHFTPDETRPGQPGIRFGLGAIKNLGQSAVESIVKAREDVGQFKGIFHFCEKVDLGALNRRMIESLIKAGAMDSLGGTRSQLMAVIDNAMETGQRAQRDRVSGQSGLFAIALGEPDHAEPPLPNVPDWTAQQKLAGEKELVGFYMTGHPLDQYRDKVCELATHNTGSLEGLERGVEVALCGILTGIQRRRNKEGKPWASMQLEDWQGSVEAMVFTTQYERVLPSLLEDQAVLVRAAVVPEEGGPSKISVQDIIALEVARVRLPSLISIKVRLGSNERAESLIRLFEKKPGDTEVRLRLEKPRDFQVLLDLPMKVRPDKEFLAEVERICGTESFEVLAN